MVSFTDILKCIRLWDFYKKTGYFLFLLCIDPTSPPMWQNRCNLHVPVAIGTASANQNQAWFTEFAEEFRMATVAIFEITYTWRLTSWRYWMTSVFYVCDVSLCNSDSKFQTSVAPLFVNKNIKCGYAYERNILVPQLLAATMPIGPSLFRSVSIAGTECWFS